MIRILNLAFLYSIAVGNSAAQCASPGLSSGSDLDYFLNQAFFAETGANRIALNHIGIETKKAESGHLITAVLEGYPAHAGDLRRGCLLYTSPSPRDRQKSRMPSSA